MRTGTVLWTASLGTGLELGNVSSVALYTRTGVQGLWDLDAEENSTRGMKTATTWVAVHMPVGCLIFHRIWTIFKSPLFATYGCIQLNKP